MDQDQLRRRIAELERRSAETLAAFHGIQGALQENRNWLAALEEKAKAEPQEQP